MTVLGVRLFGFLEELGVNIGERPLSCVLISFLLIIGLGCGRIGPPCGT